VALCERDGKRDLEVVEDGDGARLAGQPHPLGLAPRDRVREGGAERAERAIGDARGLDGDRPGRGEQALRGLAQLELLQRARQQHDEQRRPVGERAAPHGVPAASDRHTYTL